MLNLMTGKQFDGPPNAPLMTRGGFLRGILASGIAPSITMGAVAQAGSANASVSRGMMRNVGARNAAFGDHAEEPIPYRRVEYIENTGTDARIFFGGSYVQKGHFIKQFVKFAYKENIGTRKCVAGMNYASYMAPSVTSNTYWGAYWADDSHNIPVTNDTIELTQTCDGLVPNTWTLSSDSVDPYSVSNYEGYITSSVGLFCIGLDVDTYSVENLKARISSYRYWYDDELMTDAIAVRNGDVGGMYDRVSKSLFVNAGGGSFVLGPDI